MADASDTPRYFTRAQAEALLPRVEPLLRELQSLAGQLTETLDRYTTLHEKMRGNGHGHYGEYQALRERIDELRSQIDGHIREVHALGALIKDIESGLIDFPVLREGREVYLCWRLGEGERISWWHEIEAGFAGRQPLADEAPGSATA
jgi:hypothetical protein